MPLVPTWSYYPCREKHGSRRESWDRENPSANIILECDDANLRNIIYDIMVYHRPYPGNIKGAGALQKPTPELFAAEINAIHDTSRFQPEAGTNETVIDPLYTNELAVTYRPLWGRLYDPTKQGFPIDNIAGIIRTTDYAEPETEYISFDYRGFFWKYEEDGTTAYTTDKEQQLDRGGEGGWPLRRITIERTIYGLPEIIPEILDWEGRINETAWYSDMLLKNFEAETLQLKDASFVPSTANYHYPNGCYDLTTKLIYQPQGWNKFPRLVEDPNNSGQAFIDFQDLKVKYKDNSSTLDFKPFVVQDMSKILFGGESIRYYPVFPTIP